VGSCAGHFCNNSGFYFILIWLPLYLVTELGQSIELMATLTALVFVAQSVVALASGWASDRLVAGGFLSSIPRAVIRADSFSRPRSL
jgi:hypothetical protein